MLANENKCIPVTLSSSDYALRHKADHNAKIYSAKFLLACCRNTKLVQCTAAGASNLLGQSGHLAALFQVKLF